MIFIKHTAQEKHTWKHSKYEIQAHGLAEAESGWGWDGENPDLEFQDQLMITILSLPRNNWQCKLQMNVTKEK